VAEFMVRHIEILGVDLEAGLHAQIERSSTSHADAGS
jgi:hypothetical protein